MLFNSYIFLFIFLPCTLLIYYAAPKTVRNGILTIASYIFYAYWDYRFCSLVLLSTVWDYCIAKKMYQSDNSNDRKIYVFFSILVNLGLLGYFKYANFFIDSLVSLFPFIPVSPAQIILPIGISFYTFQSMSYSLDIYYNKSKPVTSFGDFACYISMFPQLVAGPIVRYHEIEHQLRSPHYSLDNICYGMRRFIQGFAKKVLIADTLAAVADPLFEIGSPSFGEAWVGAIAFSLQIYFDFSGYSDMAIGLGRVLGFSLPENFNRPYQALGISDFWRRWHMSLSAWFRDYLYIPLGGSRRSPVRICFNLVFTFLVCGLWHGASWTFVLWGGYYGVLIVLERPFRNTVIPRIPPIILIPLTYLLVTFGWVIFRCESISQSMVWLQAMVGLGTFASGSVALISPAMLAVVALCLGASWLVPAAKNHMLDRPLLTRDAGLIVLFIVSIVVMMGAKPSPFLYFQF